MERIFREGVTNQFGSAPLPEERASGNASIVRLECDAALGNAAIFIFTSGAATIGTANFRQSSHADTAGAP